MANTSVSTLGRLSSPPISSRTEKTKIMSTTSVSILGRLSSAVIVECRNEASTSHGGRNSGGVLGFMGDRTAALGRRRRAGALAALSCTSRASSSVVAFATKTKRDAAVGLDDDDEVTDFADMEEWIAKKPPGFGVKEYDTALEDRLLTEIKADQEARAAAKVKGAVREPAKKSGKKTDAPPGVEVYIGNLPKKRNVDRDLRAAFRSVQGLLHIRPILMENDKTREPVCKGLAFLTFASDDDAADFIERNHDEKVKFGKMEKKMVCELASPYSRFKKQVSQTEGTDVPRLKIIETSPINLSPAAISSSLSTIGLAGSTDSSSVESNVSDRPLVLDVGSGEEQDENVNSPEVAEDDLLEQEIWVELEDEDDFELDRELEDESKDPNVTTMNIDEVNGPKSLDDTAESSQYLGQIDVHSSHPMELLIAENDVVVERKDDKAGIQEAGSGQGFGVAHDKPDAAAVDKDKRIQDLESELKELQLHLKKRNLAELTNENVNKHNVLSRQERLEKIETLEKRVLSKARTALKKDSKVKSTKRISSPNKASSSRGNTSQPKIKSLGAASRLRKRERQIYTEVLTKYSSPGREEVAL